MKREDERQYREEKGEKGRKKDEREGKEETECNVYYIILLLYYNGKSKEVKEGTGVNNRGRGGKREKEKGGRKRERD
jgi:hypothetical protein